MLGTNNYTMGIGKTSLLIAVLLLAFVVPLNNADALVDTITRIDINNLETRINNLDEEIILKETPINTQKDLIKDKEIITNDIKQDLRELKNSSDGTWADLLEIQAVELLLSNAEDLLNDTKDQLLVLLNEKSDLIKLEDTLREQLLLDRTNLRIQNKYDHSQLTKLIGIDLASSCTEGCPTYAELFQLDSSDQSISGSIVNGERLPPDLQESWRWYDTDNEIRIIVNPPNGMAERIKMITIQPNLGAFVTVDDRKLDGNVRTWHEDVYIDHCNDAVISGDNWKFSLPHTIFSMRLGCPSVLGEFSEVLPKSEIDITTSPNYQYSLWLAEAKENCKEACK
jgi:hypothetical protein